MTPVALGDELHDIEPNTVMILSGVRVAKGAKKVEEDLRFRGQETTFVGYLEED
jgi:hypothetical protein